MSRSNPTGANSPATRFFEWKAEQGVLQFYDKATETNVEVKLPFSFLVLDEVSQVGGGTKVAGRYEGYWSNAVKNLDTQIITVKSKQGIVAQGLYAELKNRKGLHYVKGLYIGYFDEDKVLQIGYLKIKGSALGAWFDFTKTHRNIYKGAITIKSKSEVIAGDNGDYYTPVFAAKEVSPETEALAVELDKQVQEYLTAYFAHKGVEDQVAEQTTERAAAATVGGHNDPQAPTGFNPSEQDDDDIPF